MRLLIASIKRIIKGEIPSWSSLNRLGKNRFLRSSYFWFFAVPLLAKVLSKIGPEITINIFGASWTLIFSLPFSWKMFYFSSVAFAIASLCYSAGCPAIVKDYSSYNDFTEEGKTEAQLRQILQDLFLPSGISFFHGELVSRIYSIIDYLKNFTIIPQEPNIEDKILDDPRVAFKLLAHATTQQDKVPDAFWHVRGVADLNNPFLRRVCAFGYLIGFVFIGIVLMQNFIYVWKLSF